MKSGEIRWVEIWHKWQKANEKKSYVLVFKSVGGGGNSGCSVQGCTDVREILPCLGHSIAT